MRGVVAGVLVFLLAGCVPVADAPLSSQSTCQIVATRHWPYLLPVECWGWR
jgi:hypothetical protein